jgi:hypothetical protein
MAKGLDDQQKWIGKNLKANSKHTEDLMKKVINANLDAILVEENLTREQMKQSSEKSDKLQYDYFNKTIEFIIANSNRSREYLRKRFNDLSNLITYQTGFTDALVEGLVHQQTIQLSKKVDIAKTEILEQQVHNRLFAAKA